MTIKSRRPMDDRPSPRPQAGDLARAKKLAGRPKGEPSTIVNVRLPLTLVAALDRYLDRLEGHTTWKVMSQISDALKHFPCEIKGL